MYLQQKQHLTYNKNHGKSAYGGGHRKNLRSLAGSENTEDCTKDPGGCTSSTKMGIKKRAGLPDGTVQWDVHATILIHAYITGSAFLVRSD